MNVRYHGFLVFFLIAATCTIILFQYLYSCNVLFVYVFIIFTLYILVPWQTSADGSSNEVFVLLLFVSASDCHSALIYLLLGHLPRKETKFVDIQSSYFYINCKIKSVVGILKFHCLRMMRQQQKYM